MALVLYWMQKRWRGWGLQRDGPWGVGHVVFLCKAGCSCSLRKTDQKSPSGLHKTSTQGEGIIMRLSGFSVVWCIFLTLNSSLFNHQFWYGLKICLMVFSRDKQLDNSHLSILKLWRNWTQSNSENRNIVLLTPLEGLCWRKGQRMVIHIIQRKNQRLQEPTLASPAKWKLRGEDCFLCWAGKHQKRRAKWQRNRSAPAAGHKFGKEMREKLMTTTAVEQPYRNEICKVVLRQC